MTQIKREQITTEEKNKSRNEFGIRILIRKSFRLTRFISPLGPARPPGYNSLSSNKILINISQQNIVSALLALVIRLIFRTIRLKVSL